MQKKVFKSVLVGDPQAGRLADHQHGGDGLHLDFRVENFFTEGYEKFQLSTTIRGASAPVRKGGVNFVNSIVNFGAGFA